MKLELLAGDVVYAWPVLPDAATLAELAAERGLAVHPLATPEGIAAVVRAELEVTVQSHEDLVRDASSLLAERTKAKPSERDVIDAQRDELAKVILDTFPTRRAHAAAIEAIDANQHQILIDGVPLK